MRVPAAAAAVSLPRRGAVGQLNRTGAERRIGEPLPTGPIRRIVEFRVEAVARKTRK